MITDSNECEDAAANTCEQECINTVGSFSCACNAGYNTDPTDSTQCIGNLPQISYIHNHTSRDEKKSKTTSNYKLKHYKHQMIIIKV